MIHLEFSDDKGLKQYMIQLKGMSGTEQNTNPNLPILFFKLQNFGKQDTTLLGNISGTSVTKKMNFHLPDDIGGSWNLTIGILDEDGNYFSESFLVKIVNTTIPQLSIQSVFPTPNNNGIVEIAHPDSLIHFNMNGFISDATGLGSIPVRLIRNSSEVWQKTWNFSANESEFDLSLIQIDEELSSGNNSFELTPVDVEGRSAQYKAEIKIK